MKTHSSDHMTTTTTNTTAAMMTARCGMFSRRTHSFLTPLGFLLVFLYFLQIFCRVWSTVATSTDTSAIYSSGGGGESDSPSAVMVAVNYACPFKLSLPSMWMLIGMWLILLKWFGGDKQLSPDAADLSLCTLELSGWSLVRKGHKRRCLLSLGTS